MNNGKDSAVGAMSPAERVFAYLDGELGPEAREAFDRDVARDSGLADELRACRSVFRALSELEPFAPTADFRIRVLAALKDRPTLSARVHGWLLGSPRHQLPNPFAALIEPGTPRRRTRALAAFVSTDDEAATALAEWRQLHDRLDDLGHLEPSAGFRDVVMARVQRAPAKSATSLDLVARIRSLWPRRRERLAVASGIAFGPTAVVVATAYMVLSNPLVTASNVFTFAWAKLASLGGAAGTTLFGGALESSALRNAFGFLGGAVPTGPVLALGIALFAGLTLVSAWILYKNVIKVSPMDRQYVPA